MKKKNHLQMWFILQHWTAHLSEWYSQSMSDGRSTLKEIRSEMVLLSGDIKFRGSAFGESITANLGHVCLDDQSHYSLDVVEFLSELWIAVNSCLRIP